MTPERKEALNLAASSGFYLFPLSPGSKVPQKGLKWREASTTDTEQWRKWFDDPDVNIGMDCGKSELVVVDIDPRAGGIQSILGTSRAGLLLRDTLTVHTKSDGAHLIYHAHPGHELRNTAGSLPGVGPLPGIDLRASGGYVVFPSSHMEGSSWRFIDVTVPVALAPSWMRDPEIKTVQQPKITPEKLRVGYIEAALRDEGARVAGAAKGERNHALNTGAFSLGTLIGIAGLTEAQVFAVLTAAAERSGLMAEDGAAQVGKTIRSGLDAGHRKPRRVAS